MNRFSSLPMRGKGLKRRPLPHTPIPAQNRKLLTM